jgi:hypothetical protein
MTASRLRATLFLALALLFPLAASIPLACCAGIAAGAHATDTVGAPSHCGGGDGGPSCCDRAAEDAIARHCCQGGDAFERGQGSSSPVLAAATPATGLVTAPQPGAISFLASAPDPVPRAEPLYTLHSALLI